MEADKLKISETTDGKPPRPGFETAGAPAPIDPKTGQYLAYWVLSADERAKGFVRPLRRSYKHVGCRPKGATRPLTDDEDHHKKFGYVLFESYGPGALNGRFWTAEQLNSGCGHNTVMGHAIAETYARSPSYYGSTFCVNCGKHFPVDEFVWLDDPGTGKPTEERVGT